MIAVAEDTTDSETAPQWKQHAGFADATERVTILVDEDMLETWDDEVDTYGFDNRSDYLRTLIAEARAYRDNDVRDPNRAEQRIQELQSEVPEEWRERMQDVGPSENGGGGS